MVASDTSIEAPLSPAKLCKGIRKRGRKVVSRLAVQRFGLDEPGTHSNSASPRSAAGTRGWPSSRPSLSMTAV